MRGAPWFDDGNVMILSGDGETAFKLYMCLLMHNSAWFYQRLDGLSDDSAEVVDHCALIQLDKEDNFRAGSVVFLNSHAHRHNVSPHKSRSDDTS